jgi:hypothetical protein
MHALLARKVQSKLAMARGRGGRFKPGSTTVFPTKDAETGKTKYTAFARCYINDAAAG